jgi:Protein of unknown function (DUF2510)
MALFGPKFEPGTEGESRSNRISPSGRTVEPPELPGTLARRSRIFGEVVEIAKQGGDARAGAVALLAKEARFIKWASLRGAVTTISIALEDPERSLDQLRGFAGGNEPDGAVDLLRQYESRISTLSFGDVLADPSLVKTNDWHLDFVAWAARAFVGGHLYNLMVIPPAQVLDIPGWYAEPVFAKSERFWDGTDWTSKCRIQDGRLWKLINSPF